MNFENSSFWGTDPVVGPGGFGDPNESVSYITITRNTANSLVLSQQLCRENRRLFEHVFYLPYVCSTPRVLDSLSLICH